MVTGSLVNQKDSYKAWLILACGWAFYLYEYILRVSPSVMVPQLMLNFNVTSSALGLLASFYYFSYVALQVPCGVIVDSLGPRRIITLSALLCFFGSIIFAQSEVLWAAQTGRFFMGAGSACAYLSCMKIATEWFHTDRFALISGISMFMGTLGGSFGGLPFAVLVNAVGWRSSMLIFAFVGLLLSVVAFLFIQDSPANSLEKKEEVPFQGMLKGLKIISSNPQSWLVALYGCLTYLPLSAFAELWGVPFLMQRYGISNDKAALGSLYVFIGMGFGSILAAWISKIVKSRKKVMSGSALGTLGLFSLIFYGPSCPLGLTFGLLFFGGLVSGGQILYFAVSKEANPSWASGTAIGFVNCGVMISGVIFQPLLGVLLDQTWDGRMKGGLPFYTVYNYQIAFSAVCIALLLGWFLTYFIKETYRK